MFQAIDMIIGLGIGFVCGVFAGVLTCVVVICIGRYNDKKQK